MLNTIRSAFLLLLLLATQVRAQTITELPTWYIYPGNPGEKILPVAPVDSAKLANAVLYTDPNGRPLAPSLQPVLTRSGLTLLIRWPVTKDLPATGYLKVSFGQRIFYGIPVDVGVKNVNKTPAGSLTLLYPVPVVLPGSGGPSSQGSTLEYYNLGTGQNGQVVTHGKGTRFVRGAAFNQITGQYDPLWSQIEISSDSQVILRGPPAESCQCTLVLEFFKRPTQ